MLANGKLVVVPTGNGSVRLFPLIMWLEPERCDPPLSPCFQIVVQDQDSRIPDKSFIQSFHSFIYFFKLN